MEIKQILSQKENKNNIKVQGWVIYNRGNKKILFITINDGSTFSNFQVVVKKLSNFEEIEKLRIGAAVKFEGMLMMTPDASQSMELLAMKATVIKQCDEDYPLQKKVTSLEKLRTMPHLRHRATLFRAIVRIRSTISIAVHEYFKKENYIYVAAPIITSNDGEGTGDSFYVTNKGNGHFFGSSVTLGVTGQLHAEAMALGLGKVYTFAPTFRAEYSHTKRHAAEFWMIEPEVAFYDLLDIINVAHESLLFVIKQVLENNNKEIEFLSKYNGIDLTQRLGNLLTSELIKIDYSKAIEILKNKMTESGTDFFENNKIKFGTDLSTEHEKYLTDVYYKCPVVIMNYPKNIKAFYMYQNDDGKTVAAFDYLVPGVGEIIGGSQREDRYEKLVERMNEMKLDLNEYKWYLDLRKYGYAGSAGYGLGLERMIMYITGMDNIRDVLTFPRIPGNIFA